MGYSADGFPLVGEVPSEKDLFIAASFQGLGMVLSFLTAKALVATIVGSDMDESDGLPFAFRISEARLSHKFRDRLRVKPSIHLEVQSQR